MRRLTLLAGLIFLVGCAEVPQIDVVTVDSSYDAIRAGVKVLDQRELQAQPHRPLGSLLARSCQRMSADPVATESDAIAQLQIKATRLGANGVLPVECHAERGSELATNCWTAVVCRGDAVKLEN